MNDAKEKDRILAEIMAYKLLNEIEGLDKHLPELERSELVKVWRNEQGKPISVRLTKHGECFIADGGYKAAAIAKRRANVKKSLKWFLAVAAGGALTTITTILITRMLGQ